ncbi:uncharacterized protein LOC128547894 [Mercenaria mercenaria]|uniref:uncharacterized protein LOC128547894 n=1 Tax=Mercenaria mercenaria TaxID=6596 RepID=UPI00234F6588|nr:uncharacterized protein LOC128547894 [Mercenaria mercenaria]
MGCRPSRNSLGRIADSTSEYNRCYIKELDKARRKQKKSTRGGRRRTPTYNAFSSTTKCYERDEGASKITVRLSTDGSMLEIEQYDIEYTPTYNFISEASKEDRGIEMKPVGGASTSFERFQNKRFSYGRSDSAPLLLTDVGEPKSTNFCKNIYPGAACNNDNIRELNSPDISHDSISGATSCVDTGGFTPSVVAVNVHKDEGLKHDRETMFTIDPKSVNRGILLGKSDHMCVGLPDNKTDKPGLLSNSENELNSNCIGDRKKIFAQTTNNRDQFSDCKQNIYGNKPFPGDHDFQACDSDTCICQKEILDMKSKLTDGATCKCLCEQHDKRNCFEDDCMKQGNHNKEINSIVTDSPTFKLVSSNKSKSLMAEKECPTEYDTYLETHDIVRNHIHEGKINIAGKRIENQNACDRLLSYCFVCEKDKWRNEAALCAYINNKCRSYSQDFGMDSNANVCCCRQNSSHEHQISFPKFHNNTALQADDKFFLSCQTEVNGSNHRLTNKHHPTNAENPITVDIDFCKDKLCHDLLGQQTFTPNEPGAFVSDNLKCPGSSGKSMHAHAVKECLDNLCLENMNKYNCIGHTCSASEKTKISIDNFESVTMATNDVSETTLRNDGQLRCYRPVNAVEETEFSRSGDTRNCCNEYTENTDDDIYHDACGCQQCTYVTATSQCHEYTDSLGDESDYITIESNITSKANENKNVTICNIGCCDYDSIITGDIWRYKHIDVSNDDGENGDYDSGDSDSSGDYRDEEYVDAMETTYV